MPAILMTPPATEPISLADAKQHLKVETNTDDDLINNLIATARQHVEKQIDKVLVEQTWLVNFDDWTNGGELKLPVAPISSINSLRTYSDNDTVSVIDPSHYYANLVTTPQILILRGSRIWLKPGRVANGIEIEVTAGYGPSGASVPTALRAAMLMLIIYWYENRQPECHGVASEINDSKTSRSSWPLQKGSAMICIGELNKRLMIQDVTSNPDGAGGADINWIEVATVWAKVRSRHVGEKLSADAVNSSITHFITIRYLAQARPRMRFVDGAREFEILSLVNINEEDKWLSCLCRENLA